MIINKVVINLNFRCNLWIKLWDKCSWSENHNVSLWRTEKWRCTMWHEEKMYSVTFQRRHQSTADFQFIRSSDWKKQSKSHWHMPIWRLKYDLSAYFKGILLAAAEKDQRKHKVVLNCWKNILPSLHGGGLIDVLWRHILYHLLLEKWYVGGFLCVHYRQEV